MPDEYLEFDTDALLRSSFKEMIESLSNAAGKIMTSDEARAKIGLGKKPGGDELYVQMQDIPLSMAGQVRADQNKPEIPSPANDDEPDEDLTDDEKGAAAKAYLYAEFADIEPPLLLTQR